MTEDRSNLGKMLAEARAKRLERGHVMKLWQAYMIVGMFAFIPATLMLIAAAQQVGRAQVHQERAEWLLDRATEAIGEQSAKLDECLGACVSVEPLDRNADGEVIVREPYDVADYRTSEPGCPRVPWSDISVGLWKPAPGNPGYFGFGEEPCECWRARMELNDDEFGYIRLAECGQP